MENHFGMFPWSDNWWIENDKAWFVLGAQNILCHFNLDTNECEVLKSIPDQKLSKFRATSNCMRYRNDIYCFPVYGSNIWVYSIQDGFFTEITIDNLNIEHVKIHDFWEYDDKIYAVSIGLGQIIEINTKEKRIDYCYRLCREGDLARSVMAEGAIYSLSGIYGKIYKFDLVTKAIAEYELPNNLAEKYNTICFDGRNFWLSGYRKEVYVWDKEENTLNTCDDFPVEFGVYNFEKDTNGEVNCSEDEFAIPAFLYSAAVGRYIWFIPFQTNKIIYADKDSRKLNSFDIAEEMEDKNSLSERSDLKIKYILEYVKMDRYLGLFSTKNNQIIEIDTEKLTYRWCNYFINDKNLAQYASISDNLFYEEDVWGREVYNRLLHLDNHQIDQQNQDNTGSYIFNKIKSENL